MTRLTVALGLLALVIAGVAAAFLWQPGLDSLFDDSVSYLVMAQAFAPFHAADPAVVAAAAREKYPPLFPLVVAYTGGAYDWRIAHLFVALAFGASVFFLGVYARRVTGSAWLAWLLALAFAVMPGAWLNAKGILSEYPYMALTFAALVCHDRWREQSPTRGGAIALGALLAAVVLTRSIGIVLTLAIAIAEGLRFARTRDAIRLKAMAWAPAIAIVAAIAWQVARRSVADDSYASSGAVVVEGVARDGIGWIANLVAANASALADAWFNALLIFWGDWWKPQFLIAAALGIAGLGAMVRRALNAEADGLYIALYLTALLVWPFPGQMYRLGFPVVPLVMVGAFRLLCLTLERRWGPDRAARLTAWSTAAPLALCVPALLFYVTERARMPEPASGPRRTSIAEFYRIPHGPGAEANAREQLAVIEDLKRVGETTPADARVMWYTPAYVALLARRHAVPLRRPQTSADLAAQVRTGRAGYIYLADLHPRDSLRRDGDPLDAAALAAPFTRELWRRAGPRGELRAILLEVDNDKIVKGQGAP